MTIAEKLTTIGENQQKVYDAGVADGEKQAFANYVGNCNSASGFLYAFAGGGWRSNDTASRKKTYLATEDMVFDCTVNGQNMYSYSYVTDTVATINLATESGNAKGTFENATRLVTIRKLIVSEQTPTLRFTGCTKLNNITIEGIFATSQNFSPCPLTNETVQNIIDHLKDLTGQTTQTLTLKADVGAAVTDAQKAAITAKNWTLIY